MIERSYKRDLVAGGDIHTDHDAVSQQRNNVPQNRR